ncbi:hypothetical protein K435DRAFT_217025 [Dendrothele bispora CBS 962.96]|uniref:Uncharacterized protein n=1 Tax=Dendrothele bispora (strain CBS 962.96) TaxID=1314807 RepID=A0A4S8LS45_DENBC|nr:hypothetical protein K435DRAFT_217025 [Dendrothele bispora CBS 962.96]
MSSFAIMKLTYTKDLTSEITEHARLAVLSQRFALRVLFGHKDAVSFIDNSIASYMRVLLSTTEDRLWQESVYPTEPVFSNAAAQLMYQQVNSLQLFLSCLNTKILSGLIDAGVLGELISRLLILISRDWAAIITHCIEVDGPKPDLLPSAYRSPPFPSSSDHQYFPYLKPVHLLDVLNILFGYQWSPGHPQAEEIKSTFARAYISASHWLTMTRDVGLLPVKTTAEEWLKSLFLRGVAIQCRHDQPLIDKVIPILFLNESGQYDGMSCCLIQDKNRSRTIPLALRMIDIGDKSIGLKTVKPYVAICFNFVP